MSEPACPKSPTKAHHTVFDSPAAKMSKGTCKYCLHVVEQPNSVRFDKWYSYGTGKKRPKHRGGE